MRGYQYSESFKSILNMSPNAANGILVWKENWTTFMEGIFQMFSLGNDIRKIQLPVKIRKITIDRKFQENLTDIAGKFFCEINVPLFIFCIFSYGCSNCFLPKIL